MRGSAVSRVDALEKFIKQEIKASEARIIDHMGQAIQASEMRLIACLKDILKQSGHFSANYSYRVQPRNDDVWGDTATSKDHTGGADVFMDVPQTGNVDVDLREAVEKGDKAANDDVDLPQASEQGSKADNADVDIPQACDEGSKGENTDVDLPQACDEGSKGGNVDVDLPQACDEGSKGENVDVDLPHACEEGLEAEIVDLNLPKLSETPIEGQDDIAPSKPQRKSLKQS
ncbi:PREDICTED: uncharacterized protein LOC104809876 [Tarenaya hassleriana]|uniref:uncharacterized protein LOC104809876 n=1 Tax=Tarenaya hassleriana TaxID=28532 RepID=UPI00053C74D1|nr:PREDICTED: uncharacterized protein LOC104809876 [Tarenaya hassleriana]